jgi:hypothetical protein
MRRLGTVVATLALLGLATSASAHPIPFSYLDLRLQADAIEGTLVVHNFDVAHDLSVTAPERLLDPAVVSQVGGALVKLVTGRLEVAADGRVLSGSWSPPEILADRQSQRLRVRYPLDRAAATLMVTAALFPYDANHQTFLNVYEGDGLTQAILDRTRPRFEYFSGTRQGVLAVIRPPHSDWPRPSAVPDWTTVARRHVAAADDRRDCLHDRAQHHAVAGRVEPRHASGPHHRTRYRPQQHRVRWHRQPPRPRRPRRARLDCICFRVHSRLRFRERPP